MSIKKDIVERVCYYQADFVGGGYTPYVFNRLVDGRERKLWLPRAKYATRTEAHDAAVDWLIEKGFLPRLTYLRKSFAVLPSKEPLCIELIANTTRRLETVHQFLSDLEYPVYFSFFRSSGDSLYMEATIRVVSLARAFLKGIEVGKTLN